MQSIYSTEEKIFYVQTQIKSFPDFPKPGVIFRDIFSAIAKVPVSKVLHEILVEHIKTHFPGVEVVVGLESRGFLFAFAVAAELNIGCLPVRKKGKLPGNVKACTYNLEYGTDVFEIQTDSLKSGMKCLLIDDLLATGGSLQAAANLLQSCGCNVVGCLVVMELLALSGRKKIPDEITVHSLIKDIFSAIAQGPVCKILLELLVDHIRTNFPGVEAVVGLESRGFLFVFAVAAELQIGCFPVRKKGKLPGNLKACTYSLEYGTDTFEIQTEYLKKGMKCLLIDDLLATGGSLEAAMHLLKSCQCDVMGCLVVIEKVPLHGRNKIQDVPVHSLIKQYD